jgi:adenosylmethionine-8-amino-7-oxononanoate aminotransferase
MFTLRHSPLRIAARYDSRVLGSCRAISSYKDLCSSKGAVGFPNVNKRFQPEPTQERKLPTEDNTTGTPSRKHWEAASEWSAEDIKQAAVDHAMLTWSPTSPVQGIPVIDRAEGVYLYDSKGKQYLDWTSEAVCVNLGHTVPESVKRGMMDALETTPFLYGGMALAPIRARMSSLIAELAPGDLNGFLFPCSGGEANDCAIRMARLYTGKSKIFSQYRSYHGGSLGPLGATGDFRRHFGADHATGFVKIFNPEPHFFHWGDTDEKAREMALGSLEEQIVSEGPATIAAIMLESVPGSAGVLIPAVGYMEGVRALCDKYGILMICDEVMTGFGRTGELFAFQHYEGVIPDIFTSAKGLTGSWQPLSVVGCRQKIKDFFWDKPIGWGSTFQGHPVALACGYEALKHFLDTDILGNVKNVIQPILLEELNRLVDKYMCVKQGRVIGAFGCMDLMNPKTGKKVMELGAPMPPAVANFKKAFNEEGLIGFLRPPQVHCAPPLVITADELRDGFQRLDRALAVLEKELTA